MIRFPKDLEPQIKAQAEKNGVSVNQFVIGAVITALQPVQPQTVTEQPKETPVTGFRSPLNEKIALMQANERLHALQAKTAKKAARIRSNVRQFFRYYRDQLETTESERLKEFNLAELQALETVQAETLQALESMTDPELLASKAAYGDRALIDRITARAERIRRTSKQIA